MKNILLLFFLIPCLYSFNFEDIEQHIEKKLAEAKIEEYPFPHLVIEEILPPSFYAELLLHWPKQSFQNVSAAWRKKVPLFTSWDENTVWSPDEYADYQLWRDFADRIVNQLIKKKIGELFYPYTFHRFGETIPGPYLCNSLDMRDHGLCEDRGAGIGPHVDQAYLFAQVMIYFPPPSDLAHADLGTCFWTHRAGRTCVDICFDSQSNLEFAKMIPYKPNTLCAFMQTPHGWHSAVVNHPFGGYVRQLYITGIYLSSAFLQAHYGETFNLRGAFGLERGLDEENGY